jgi:hypothetical protein
MSSLSGSDKINKRQPMRLSDKQQELSGLTMKTQIQAAAYQISSCIEQKP